MEVANKLKELNLPELQDRESMKKILLEREYGYVPEMPFEIAVSEAKKIEGRYCCGTAAVSRVELTITTQYGSHTFPVHRLLHDDGKKHPFFVFLNFILSFFLYSSHKPTDKESYNASYYSCQNQ